MIKLSKKQHNIKISALVLSCCMALLFILPTLSNCESKKLDYGVFLGIDSSDIGKLKAYKTVVIDPYNFSKSDIEKLHKDGKTVYGYLNVGSLEEFRPYFERFKNITLGTYENWPDEHWLNVTAEAWQSFVVHELGKEYAKKGIDGFFIDNADVYYQYPKEESFEALCSIMRGLKEYRLKILINGGDVFVSRCIDENIASELFDGINQECVFTGIDFENKSYRAQEKAETERYKEYLSRVRASSLEIYLLEYGADAARSTLIETYCKQIGAKWYNAKSLELK